MNTILTDDEIATAIAHLYAGPEVLAMALPDELHSARAVEAAVLAKLAQQEPVACVTVEQLSKMAESLEGHDKGQFGYHWRKGWNAALRCAMDYAHPAPQQADRQRQPEAPTDPIRVACISLDGITLTVPADQLNALGVGDEGDNDTYALTFKTMTRAEYDALGEFDGF